MYFLALKHCISASNYYLKHELHNFYAEYACKWIFELGLKIRCTASRVSGLNHCFTLIKVVDVDVLCLQSEVKEATLSSWSVRLAQSGVVGEVFKLISVQEGQHNF